MNAREAAAVVSPRVATMATRFTRLHGAQDAHTEPTAAFERLHGTQTITEMVAHQTSKDGWLRPVMFF